uniref:Uncharacterized protein n=1 Tax=Spongospora subterranea TaxID=70186 RepID=A0A0H5QVI9_9EUKA|eukprot:CRZ05616.1 hypothetical protein [Spongospora subterranea]
MSGDQTSSSSTRLDRLFSLLEVGSNSLTRKTAAQQIGDVQKYHPHELQNLLFRLRKYLHHKSWDTRTAAGQAVEYICSHVKPFSPNWDPDIKPPDLEIFRVALRFSDFELPEIIAKGQHLLASGGTEFNADAGLESLDPKARIEIQKKRLLKRLGFDQKLDCGLENLFRDEDFELQQAATVKQEDSSKKTAGDVVSSMEKLSSREINRLKRLEKKQLKQKPGATGTSSKTHTSQPQTVVNDSVVDPTQMVDLHTEWPFSSISEQLLHDLFDPIWEVRHGAGVALRAVLQVHGRWSGMSVFSAQSESDLDLQHIEWVDDCAIRLLCVLALDKFSDYASGQAVCPVRETCSQVIGVLMQHAPETTVMLVMERLLYLSMREEWELRHSGFLALKYVFAVRGDVVANRFVDITPALLKGLNDSSDDVRAIVADSLQSIIHIAVTASNSLLPSLLSTLWNTITHYDDLSAATASVLQALYFFYSYPETVACHLDLTLGDYIPRIWPCLSHSTVAVRMTALQTLLQIVDALPGSASWFTEELQRSWLLAQFQALVFEEDPTAVEASLQLWRSLVGLISRLSPSTLPSPRSDGLIHSMVLLACTGPNDAVDPQFLDGFLRSEDNQVDADEPPVKKAKPSPESSANVRGSTAMLLRGATALSTTIPFLSRESVQRIAHLLEEFRAYTRICGCVIWADSGLSTAIPQIVENLGPLSYAATKFSEFQFYHQRIYALVQDLCLKQKLPVPNPFSIESAVVLVSNECIATEPSLCQAITATKSRLESECRALVSTIHACAAAAFLSCQEALPDKLNPIIKPLLKSVENQRQPELQERAAKALGVLIRRCVGRSGSSNTKLLQKLVAAATLIRGESPDEKRLLELRGAKRTLRAVCEACGPDLFKMLPLTFQMSSQTMSAFISDNMQQSDWTNELNEASLFIEMQFLSLLILYADRGLVLSELSNLLPLVTHCLKHPSSTILNQAASVITDFCRAELVASFEFVLKDVLPRLSVQKDDVGRVGANVCIHSCITELGILIVPYLGFLIGPVLAQMTDPVAKIREIASLSFAAAVRLMPLEAGVADPTGMSSEFRLRRVQQREFISQLLDGTKIADYVIPVNIRAELRRYQQEGVNWLSFLQKFNLHGILCDDMGLGKTLQTVCILASSVSERRRSNQEVLPTLVICPSTLIHHWVEEIGKFCDAADLSGVAYDGSASLRALTRSKVLSNVGDNVVVMSYQVWRSDLSYLSSVRWNYCVLDEGHIIKNPKSKLTEAIKLVRANHRLVLSGTPIQNVVTDLWSIFDFLMPGYLGSSSYFNSKFSKPISLGNSSKASDKDQEASIGALEALHKQVLPFLLRRVKEDVLKDLPEKIIQDYYCDLSPLQVELYESFSKSGVAKEVQSELSYEAAKANDSANPQSAKHVFQILQYLRKLVTHPALVLDHDHPEYERVMAELKQQNRSIHDIELAPKLLALQQLLLDSGIGVEQPSAVSQHRVLLFAQLKSVLDIVQEDLFKQHMPNITYLRLDGSMSPADRFGVVKRFNADPTIDILLLTTHVGGLGLNLTGADTVIFLEHDWNPSKDLQAMDRAHRIGQTKVVNVYRLITRQTLEEKVMRLQKWKQSLANTIITQDNSSLRSLDTDQVLDLMTVSSERGQHPSSRSSTTELDALGNINTGKKTGMKAMIEGLQEMWDESQYEEEYNLNQFIKKLQ